MPYVCEVNCYVDGRLYREGTVVSDAAMKHMVDSVPWGEKAKPTHIRHFTKTDSTPTREADTGPIKVAPHNVSADTGVVEKRGPGRPKAAE